MSFGQKLKSIRKERKISQTELAQASGVAQRTISSYETDLSIPRTSNQLRKIADVLGVTPADLVSDDDRFLISSEEVEYKVEAKRLVAELTSLFSGGKMDEDDMDVLMLSMQQAYVEAKKKHHVDANA